MHISFLSPWRYSHTMGWAILMSLLIVGLAATLGRATINLRGALTAEDASLAVIMLLPNEHISNLTVIRAGAETQELLAETKDGPKLIRVRRVEGKWEVQEEIRLRE